MRHFKLIISFLILGVKGISQTNIKLIMPTGKTITSVYAEDFSLRENRQIYNYQHTINFPFSKTNKIDLYTIGCFINNKQPWTQIWLDDDSVTVYAHLDSTKFIIDTVLNSPMYYYVNNIFKDYYNLHKSKDTALCNEFLFQKFKENIDNPFSLRICTYILNLNQNNKTEIQKLKEVIVTQAGKFSWFREYEDVHDRIKKILATDQLILSDYKFIGKKGETTILKINKDTSYILDFWFLGCAPCREDHKLIKQNLKKLKQNKINVIGISTDKYSTKWSRYLLDRQYNWPNYLQSNATPITDVLGINSFPKYVLINSYGKILGRYNTFSDILEKFKINQ